MINLQPNFFKVRSPLIFVDQGSKINAKCYGENILKPMLESAKNHFGEDTLWTF